MNNPKWEVRFDACIVERRISADNQALSMTRPDDGDVVTTVTAVPVSPPPRGHGTPSSLLLSTPNINTDALLQFAPNQSLLLCFIYVINYI